MKMNLSLGDVDTSTLTEEQIGNLLVAACMCAWGLCEGFVDGDEQFLHSVLQSVGLSTPTANED